jgi:hypothetical protein
MRAHTHTLTHTQSKKGVANCWCWLVFHNVMEGICIHNILRRGSNKQNKLRAKQSMLMEGPDLGLDLEEDEPFLTHKQRTEQLTPTSYSIRSPSKSPANDNHTPQLLSPTSEPGGQRTFDWGGFDQVIAMLPSRPFTARFALCCWGWRWWTKCRLLMALVCFRRRERFTVVGWLGYVPCLVGN